MADFDSQESREPSKEEIMASVQQTIEKKVQPTKTDEETVCGFSK